MRAFLVVAMGITLFASTALRAQEQLGAKADLEKAFKDSGTRWKKLLAGEEPPGKGDHDIARAVANYHLYRLTHITEPGGTVVKDFSDFINKYPPEAATKRNNIKFLSDYMGPALVGSMKDVLTDPKRDRGQVVHAAMMLPVMAKVKSDAVFEYCAVLTKDSKSHDIIKLYALKALREALPITDQPGELYLDFNNPAQNAKRARDAKVVDALKDYIERPVDVSAMSYEEASAVRFIRREAIITLAQAGAPAVLAVPKKLENKNHKNPQGLVAPTLLKVLASNVQPPPSTQEKIEAAIGLCNMKHPNMPEYNPALATYLIGQAVLDMSAEYSKDLQNFTAGDKRLPYIAWKSEAKRLKAGLDAFAKTAKTKHAVELKASADKVFDAMENHKTIIDANLGDLRRNVNDTRATATDTIFMTVPAPKVFPNK